MPRGKAAVMGIHLKRSQRVVEFVAATDGECLLPVSGMRVQRITEFMMASIRVGIGPGWRPEEGKPKRSSLSVIPIFRFVDQTETVVAVAKVCPAQRGDLEFRRFPSIVARGGAFDRPIGNFVSCMRGLRDCQGKRRFQ